MRDEDLEVVVATAGTGDDVLTTPEDTIRDLVTDMLAGEPYLVTHGSKAAEIRARHQAIEDAHARMRDARDRRTARDAP